MARAPLFTHIRKLRRPVFTTRELSALSGKSLSAMALVPYLLPGHRVYVSFISALHLHGIVEQIPHVVTLASTAHSRTIRTALGDFIVHRLAPAFFTGFDWYRGERSFLMASPEKALVDSIYLSAHRKKQYRHFPELRFPPAFSFRKAVDWARRIPSARVGRRVLDDLERLKQKAQPT